MLDFILKSNQIKDIKEEAAKTLLKNPDVVFEEMMRLPIERDDLAFWKMFVARWQGSLKYLDDLNESSKSTDEVEQVKYEYSKRSYRLGFLVLDAIYYAVDQWEKCEEKSPLQLKLDALHCYFLPAYLADYGSLHPEEKQRAEKYIEQIASHFSERGDAQSCLNALHMIVQQYIENMHIYAQQNQV